jgi:NAD(P)-dependent dehydrogenase (short-subunit alcohol dehydrogenase family)
LAIGNLEGLGYSGATVMLTGGASGMGEATARILGDLGASVHIADIAEPKVACASYHQLDLSDFAAGRTTTAELRKFGPIDFLFPLAGIPPHALGPLQCMMVNYIGTRLFTEELLPAVKDGGTIGLIASTAARHWQAHLEESLGIVALDIPEAVRDWYRVNPESLRDGYSSSKELLAIWVQQAAIRLGEERRIRINCIAPCPVATPFMEATAEVLGRDFVENYPYPLLGRMATAEEQAWSLLLLSSPLNAAVTGAMLYTDQGYAGGLATGALQPAVYKPTK